MENSLALYFMKSTWRVPTLLREVLRYCHPAKLRELAGLCASGADISVTGQIRHSSSQISSKESAAGNTNRVDRTDVGLKAHSQWRAMNLRWKRSKRSDLSNASFSPVRRVPSILLSRRQDESSSWLCERLVLSTWRVAMEGHCRAVQCSAPGPTISSQPS